MANKLDIRAMGLPRTSRPLSKTMRKSTPPLIGILGPALGAAFLIPHPWIGALLWFGVFQNLRYAAFALLGVAIAEGIGRAFRIRETSPIDGSLKANALLISLAVAWLTESANIPVETQLIVGVAAAVIATIVSAAIMKLLSGTDVPPLALGYCMVAVMLFAIFPNWTYAATMSMTWWAVPTDALGWVVTFFRTLGALLFSPTLGVGIVVAAAVLLWSRVAFLAGVIGWTAGILTAIAVGQQDVVYYWMPTAYNFFLAGMAVGASFFLPGRLSPIMAAVGGCTASLIAVEFQHLLPNTAFGYLPIVSILTIWFRIYALALAEGQTFSQRNRVVSVPPEEAWWHATYWARRSKGAGPLLIVPIGGRAQILQGMDGTLSHVGAWRHALDFQAIGDEQSNGVVIAPAAGIVERIRNDVADNPLGICNYIENWGNFVIIRLDQGGWAMLAHLREGSIVVHPGMRVETGAYIGVTGNSGRSPIPHLHLQVQSGPELGAPTTPFRLANFLSATAEQEPLIHWHSVAVPSEGAILSPAPVNNAAYHVLAGLAPGSAVWDSEVDGVVPRPFRSAHAALSSNIVTSLDSAGRYLFKGATGGALVSELDPDAWRVIELQADAAPLLKLLALGLPSIPYAASPGMTWSEPAPVSPFGLLRWLGLALSPYLSEPFPYVRCRCVSTPDGDRGLLVIETHLETPWSWLPQKVTCKLDQLRGPVSVEAVFEKGTLRFSLVSFEPGLPFGADI